MTLRQLVLLLGMLLIGLSIGRGVKADELDALEAQCPAGAEFRLMYRRESSPVRISRLYVGCRHPETLMRWTWMAQLDAAQEAQLRSMGSQMLTTSRSWARPKLATMPVFLRALTTCDRYWLWADDEGKRAPQMTRSRKLAQVCSG